MLRCLEISTISEIFVVTNESQKFFVIGQVKELDYNIPKENILIEPEGKNTLPAISFGMKIIEDRFGKSTVGVFSSDHVLEKSAMKPIISAEKLVTDHLVTFGIVPKSVHTGYGYIKPAESLEIGNRVSEFREKPDSSLAEKYINEGCLWNSGMFLFDTDVFFSELKKHAPGIFDAFSLSENISAKNIKDIFSDLPSLSIDYGIMEKSNRVAVVRIDENWSDLGNFDAMYDELEKDETGNVIYGCDDALVDSTGNLIYSKPGKIVSLIDVNDMVVVDTPDALLVCPRNSSQKVKEVVTALKDNNDERAYLHQTVYRPWGSYTILEKSEHHQIKNIMVMPEKRLSLQLHHHRSEHWVVMKGMACVEVNGEQYFLRPGESTFIRAGMKHRLSNPGTLALEITEVQLGDYVGEDDIVRYDDEYGRV